MKKRFLSLAIVILIILMMSLPGNTIAAQTVNKNWDSMKYGDKIDIGPKLRKMEKNNKIKGKLKESLYISSEKLATDPASKSSSQSTASAASIIGTVKIFPANDIDGVTLKQFTLKSIGEKCEVWLANNLTFLDGRPTPVITQEQLNRVRDEFDKNIYEKDTQFFGTPDQHIGLNAQLPGLVSKKLGMTSDYYYSEDGKTIILVDNINDEQYNDPSYPFFIAGFYWGLFEAYTDRNIITIDTKDWDVRLVKDFLPTIAHEFQHLIHDDNDNGEETWINEGMADFAQYLCGYGHDWGHVNFYLNHPENSLVSWDEYYSAETGPETLADYGQAYLFQLYLNDHLGQNFIQTLAKDTEHGIQSVNKVLQQYQCGFDFSELYRRFTLAVAVDNPALDAGIYSFSSIDLNVDYAGAAKYNKLGVPAWGADYIALNNARDVQSVRFTGLEYAPTPWQVVNDPLRAVNKVLWGNQGDEVDNFLIMEADLTGKSKATLTFDSFISIEDQWDYGFVQVSTDNGITWRSLANKNTTSNFVSDGYPAIGKNLPGFTGISHRWALQSFDLSSCAGQKVLIAFRYMTDWSSNEKGWYIDNISIPEISYFNSCDSTSGLMSIDQVKGNRVTYAVALISKKGSLCNIMNIPSFNISGEKLIELGKFFAGGDGFMVIWYQAPEGRKDPIYYNYSTVTRK